jgi:Glycosyl transferase family 2
MNAATILIPARDSAATIQRAVRSAWMQEGCRVLLIDDWSSDGTAAVARAAFPSLQVLRPVEHRTLGAARQAGLDAVDTDYVIWLDSDDELLAGRAKRLVRELEESGGDFAADAVELVDGRTGASRGRLPIPRFLKKDLTLSRLFERNYLPAPGAVAIRTETARRLGYDAAFHGAEDLDLLLRAVASGARWRLVDEPGYRQCAYPASLSRNLANQRQMLSAALGKHAYADIARCLDRGGWPACVREWAVVSVALFRADWQEALARLEGLAADCADPDAVLEADGPCPLPEGWRLSFQLGTTKALMGDARSALVDLRRACELEAAPEAANNFGVALRMEGNAGQARTMFQRAADGFKGYADALANLADPSVCRLTTHPLRRDAWRDDYGRAS